MLNWIRALYNTLVDTVRLTLGVFPTSADGAAAVAVQLAAAAVAWTWGAWTQIVLAAGVTSDVGIYGVTLENFVGSVSQGEVAIGTGTAPAGSEIARVPIVSPVYYFPRPIRVRAGNGLVARYRTSTGVADNVSVKLLTESNAGL